MRCFPSLAIAAIAAIVSGAPQSSTPTGPAGPASTACGDLIRQADGRKSMCLYITD